MIYNEIHNIKRVLIDSNQVITENDEIKVINSYKKLVYGANNKNHKNLYSMQPISAEVQHIIDKIPNKYSATDKADGEKYALYVYENNIYLISNNLQIRKTNLQIKDLNNTLLEGELIHLTTARKYLYMCFDCLFYKGKDIRTESNLEKRFNILKEVCVDMGFNIYNQEPYTNSFEFTKILKHYNKDMKQFYSHLDKVIKKTKINELIIHPKFFLFPVGSDNSEIFAYSYLIWKNCTQDKDIKCPYTLDGIIYTGLEQKYTRDRREHKYPIYKYKPPVLNSVDVYITFQRNKDTGNYLEIFDNTLPDKVEDQIFRVVNFFVGDLMGDKEVPIPFMINEDNHEAFIPLIRGQVRDVEGNIVQDKTVIEITYNNDLSIPHKYRWKILRTRWDKTHSVLEYGRKYGNFKSSAISVWKSIREAVTIEEIKNLAKPSTYYTQKKILESRLNSSIITSDRQQDLYYQKITNLCKPMRNFHNWIKSIMVYTYCGVKTINHKEIKKSVLDIGCGRGGDLLKYYHARVGDYVGIDSSYEGIHSSTDGAIKRYNIFKAKFPHFGKITFIHADGSVPFNSEDQNKKISNLSIENKKLIDKVFTTNRKFDVLTSFFAIHYLFDNKTSVLNLINNIKTYLKKDGFVLLTLFDTKQIEKILNNKNIFTSYYTDDEGERVKLFEIIKKYSGEIKDKPGQAIDVHQRWINDEGKYYQEYLVSFKLLKNTMKEAGCRLVDSDLFLNLYKTNKDYFTNVIEHEENPKNMKFYKEIARFYGNLNSVDKETKLYSFLSRYYVFQKIN